MASSPVQVNLTLTLPAVVLHMPLAADPRLTTTVSPPVAHWGPGPVHVRLISCELREGQVSCGPNEPSASESAQPSKRPPETSGPKLTRRLR